jgi:hypothetical protein
VEWLLLTIAICGKFSYVCDLRVDRFLTKAECDAQAHERGKLYHTSTLCYPVAALPPGSLQEKKRDPTAPRSDDFLRNPVR